MPSQPHVVDLHVGARLRLGRRLGKLSQDVLGQAAGVTFQQVQKYECGANRISASALHAFARRLDRPIDWFFEGLEAPAFSVVAPAWVQSFMAVGEAPELVEGLLALPPNSRRHLINLIRAAAETSD